MVLEYDFDIVVNEELEDNAGSERLDNSVARARFRHVKTADALRATSPKIRQIFQEAGFDLDSTDSKLSQGYYSSRDVDQRKRILHALFANIREMGIEGEYCGEFDFHRFLDNVKTAKPRNDQRRTLPGRIGVALGLAVILFAVLRYLAEKGATP